MNPRPHSNSSRAGTDTLSANPCRALEAHARRPHTKCTYPYASSSSSSFRGRHTVESNSCWCRLCRCRHYHRHKSAALVRASKPARCSAYGEKLLRAMVFVHASSRAHLHGASTLPQAVIKRLTVVRECAAGWRCLGAKTRAAHPSQQYNNK